MVTWLRRLFQRFLRGGRAFDKLWIENADLRAENEHNRPILAALRPLVKRPGGWLLVSPGSVIYEILREQGNWALAESGKVVTWPGAKRLSAPILLQDTEENVYVAHSRIDPEGFLLAERTRGPTPRDFDKFVREYGRPTSTGLP